MTGAEDGANERLATYGTLAPGRANAGQLDDLTGTWREGWVRGRLVAAGRGAEAGYPGLALSERADAAAEEVPVWLFESADLPAHWARLDAFEGADYRRVTVAVRLSEGSVAASIYVLADRTSARAP